MSDEELSALRTEAEAAGVKVDRRWGADRLRAEIALMRGDTVQDVRVFDEPPADADEPQDAGPPAAAEDADAADADEAVDGPAEVPAVHRAGGHIDRGDGYGWVIEQDEE